MKKIILFIPYFGPLPANFSLWAKSCGANADIDWVLMTDHESPCALPPNVHHIRTDLDSLRAQFSNRLGFSVTLDRPYKLVDYKPAYGYLFPDLVQGYDFWGHCDLDVVFGDIRAFFTDAVMDRYDKIQERGHLSIYRNDERTNALFMEQCENVVDYRKVYADSSIYCYDEFRGIYRICKRKGISYTDIDTLVAIRPNKGYFEEALTGRKRIVPYWERGKTYMAYLERGEVRVQEVIYVHFRRRRMEAPAFDPDTVDAFYMVPNTFIPKEPGAPGKKEIRRLRRGRPIYGLQKGAKRFCHKWALKPVRWLRRRFGKGE